MYRFWANGFAIIKEKEVDLMEFTIRAPKWTLVVFVIGIVLFSLTSVGAVILYFANVCPLDTFLPMFGCFVFFLLLCCLGVYVYKTEVFSLKDGV